MIAEAPQIYTNYMTEIAIQVKNNSRFESRISQPEQTNKTEMLKLSLFFPVVSSVQTLRIQLINRLTECAQYEENWDGYGASKISTETISQAKSFINGYDIEALKYLDSKNIFPTPYGTIVMDFYKGSNNLSLEFGKTKVGFYTEFENIPNLRSEGIKFDKTAAIPEELQKAFTVFLNV